MRGCGEYIKKRTLAMGVWGEYIKKRTLAMEVHVRYYHLYKVDN
jgi:hypothetical protein